MENLDIFLLALFCFLMGAFLVGGAVYWRNLTVKHSPANPEEAPEADLVEIARLWRSRKSNQMVVEVEGQRHISANELSAEQRQGMTTAAASLHTWMSATEPSAVLQTASSPPETSKEQLKSAPVFQVNEVKPVPARPLDALNRAFISTPAKTVPQFKSIAAQINEVLQAHLPGSPFEAAGIDLVETPDQGVIVRVGTKEYPGVEAVPDVAVRSFIKAAVAEWEANIRAGIR